MNIGEEEEIIEVIPVAVPSEEPSIVDEPVEEPQREEEPAPA